ncbi:MAG: sulfatase [Planctomycetota bacterium]|nr:sulfatase [Planctomycetota bacterium]
MPSLNRCALVARTLLFTSLSITCVTSGGELLAAEPTKRPNVVLILVDDLGWRDWSSAGNEICVTPTLDKLAREGMHFTQAYAACAVCSPTRAAVQTGRYPGRVGVTDWIRSQFQRPGGKTPKANPTKYIGGAKNKVLCPPNPFWMESDEITLAEMLRPAGYHTAYIGKWHLGDEAWYPEHQGFEVNFGGCDYGQPPNYFDPFNQPRGRHQSLRDGIFKLPSRDPGEYLTDREADEACKLIRQWKDEPFFIQLSHYAVHTPIQAPKDHIDKYLKHGVNRQQATYAAMVESVDRALAKVQVTLRELELEEKTIIWFTSDNGGLDNGKGVPTENLPLRQGKGHPYEGGIRIPTIVSWPGVVPASASSNTPICSIDILPTLTECCGVETPNGHVIDGVSLKNHLVSGGKEDLVSRPLIWHFPHYRGSITPYSIIRDGDWKLLHYYAGKNGKGAGSELYNLASDPGERKNVIDANPELAERLKRSLMTELNSMNAKLPRENPNYSGK